MNPATWLGVLFRRVSSLENARAVRYDDDIRTARTGGAMQQRIEEIHRQVVALEHQLGIPPQP